MEALKLELSRSLEEGLAKLELKAAHGLPGDDDTPG